MLEGEQREQSGVALETDVAVALSHKGRLAS